MAPFPQDAGRPFPDGQNSPNLRKAAAAHSAGEPVILPMSPFVRSSNGPDHDLTVVIPAYNEAERLPKTLDGLEEYLSNWGIDYRVIVVDDGSRDHTASLVDCHGPRYSVIRQPNGGKGSAVRNGMLHATGHVIAFTDADLPYHLDALKAGYEEICSNQADVVFGARDLKESTALAPRKFWRSIAHEVFRQCMRLLVSRQVGDTQCGLKIFGNAATQAIFSRCEINGFAFDAEVVYLTHALGLSFSKVPVILINEYASTISLTRHALPMLLDVVRMRWRSLTYTPAVPEFEEVPVESVAAHIGDADVVRIEHAEEATERRRRPAA